MEFKDRVANKPNRVKLTYEDDGTSDFATVELADEPIDEGTPLNASNMNKLLNKEDADYIVEQGTSGIWTYRKWNSGFVDIWGMAVLNEFGDTRHIYKNEDLPFAFVERPVVNMTLYYAEQSTHTQGDIVLSNVYWENTTTMRLSMIRGSGRLEEGDTAQVNVAIKGKWK